MPPTYQNTLLVIISCLQVISLMYTHLALYVSSIDAVPKSSVYGNGYSFNVTPPTLSWGGANSTAMFQVFLLPHDSVSKRTVFYLSCCHQSSPQCFPNMYPMFQPRQMLPSEFDIS